MHLRGFCFAVLAFEICECLSERYLWIRLSEFLSLGKNNELIRKRSRYFSETICYYLKWSWWHSFPEARRQMVPRWSTRGYHEIKQSFILTANWFANHSNCTVVFTLFIHFSIKRKAVKVENFEVKDAVLTSSFLKVKHNNES